MKNIHVLPTEKPSRLFKFANELHLDTIPKDYYKKYNIYITNDEKPKSEDWCLSKLNEVVRFGKKFTSSLYKKIILTTDQELIEEGIQAIDDEFLEWFVKNPSCEMAHVVYDRDIITEGLQTLKFGGYRIIIPQEEPKSHIEYTNTNDFTSMIYNPQEESNFSEVTIKAFEKSMDLTLESEPETLEEAADNFANSKEWINGGASNWVQFSFKKGAEWQAERMEEELREAFKQGHSSARKGSYNQITEQEDFDKWIEQFKNK
jgi:mRNA-degrading endonuclease RelE of RelBE toxin-antitoxin system